MNITGLQTTNILEREDFAIREKSPNVLLRLLFSATLKEGLFVLWEKIDFQGLLKIEIRENWRRLLL